MTAKGYVRTTLAAGIGLLVLVGAITLTRSPPQVVLETHKVTAVLGSTESDAALCQAGEALPAGVSAIRVSLWAYLGARVRLAVFSDDHLVAEGSRGPDWSGTTVTVPVKPLRRAAQDIRLCVSVGPNRQPIFVQGYPTSSRYAARLDTGGALGGRLGVEYLAQSSGSWYTRVLTVARHMGLGHALTGTWVALLIAALMAAVGVMAVGLTLRETT
jgi:hypothetical protein